LVITDSGLGGLTICAQIVRALGADTASPDVRITYVNAWPEEGRGYNSLPDIPSRARVFDRALRRMHHMRPDAIVIACNTLSILYDATAFQKDAPVPVHGIVNAGVELFDAALRAEGGSTLVLLGTRTTVESGAHRDRLVQRGVAPGRITAASCHGLATAIEQEPDGAAAGALIDTCAQAASAAGPMGEPLLAGLCCTHYAMIESRFRAALAKHTGRTIITLDPNVRLVEEVVARVPREARRHSDEGRTPAVEVISKVTLTAAQRSGIGRIIGRASPSTARALHEYRHVPDLF
jgi:glutamate racemase